ncbi:hypothetical protein [Streptomyces sp. NPDC020742]|uniref:hypothetical protein n=1 Tax=unclassified Streptomyces TaxID=2593676 RepID=UPI0033FB3341
MQRGLVHAAAWTLATGAAVTLSWFGVHTVLSGTAYDAPRALPLADQAESSGADDDAVPQVSSTHRPRPSASPSPDGGVPSKPPTPSATGGAPAHPPSAPAPRGGASGATGDGNVKSYATAGGRVVFAMGSSSAELVSATPNSGWEMQVWKQDGWIRVDFSGSGGHTSVFCTWNGHPPMVQTTRS